MSSLNDINAFFWSKITITGRHAQESNQFQSGLTIQSSQLPPPTSATADHHHSTAGSAAAHNAAPTPAVAPVPAAAHNAALVPAPRAPDNRPPFDSAALLRPRPILVDYPDFPSWDEIELRIRQFFAIYPENQEPPILEPIDEDTLYSKPVEPTQKLFFLCRSNPPPVPTTWDPIVFCDGDGEQECFHCTIRQLRIIHTTRWITGAAKKDKQLRADLQALLERQVPSFGHMILLSYAVRLRDKATNVRELIDFLTKMLNSRDFDHEIPQLLADYQPRLLSPGITVPWPSEHDFRVAAKRWLCYCQRAYTDIFERLSGMVNWTPEWMLSKILPSAARQAFDRISTMAPVQLDMLRHMVYRHFGLKHVFAALHHLDFEWSPLDHIKDEDLLAEGELVSMHKTICLVDEYTLHYFGAARQDQVSMILIPSTDSAHLIDYVLDLYPNRDAQRIVFWFGSSYVVDYDNGGYGGLVAFLSHHFATYFSALEQIVIAPPYAQTHADTWTNNVLGLLVQKEVMLPYARLINDPHDLQLWRHDYYPTATARASSTWPSQHLTPNGRLRNPHIAELRKFRLRKYHRLDLWTYYESDHRTAPIPASILERTADGQFTEPGIVKVAAHNAASETQSTSSTTLAAAHNAVASVLPPSPTSASIAEQNPRAADAKVATDASATLQPLATPDAATSSAQSAPIIAAPAASQAVPATIADIEARIAQLSADLAALKDLLPKPTVTSGPSAPTRSPDTDPEKDA